MDTGARLPAWQWQNPCLSKPSLVSRCPFPRSICWTRVVWPVLQLLYLEKSSGCPQNWRWQGEIQVQKHHRTNVENANHNSNPKAEWMTFHITNRGKLYTTTSPSVRQGWCLWCQKLQCQRPLRKFSHVEHNETTNATIVDAVQYLMIVSRVSETFSGMITGIAQRRKRKEPLKASSEFLAKRGFIRCPKKFCTLYRTISDPTPFNRTISCCHMQRASVHQDLCVWILGIHISWGPHANCIHKRLLFAITKAC